MTRLMKQWCLITLLVIAITSQPVLASVAFAQDAPAPTSEASVTAEATPDAPPAETPVETPAPADETPAPPAESTETPVQPVMTEAPAEPTPTETGTPESSATTEAPVEPGTPEATATSAPAETSYRTASSACPAGKAAVTKYSFRIYRNGQKIATTTSLANVRQGDEVYADFEIHRDCTDVVVSFPAYQAPEPYYDVNTVHKQVYIPTDGDTGVFGPQGGTVRTVVPTCYFQIDFVWGPVIPQLTKSNLYGDRKLAWRNSGTVACSAGTPTPTPTQTSTPTATPTPVDPPVAFKAGTASTLNSTLSADAFDGDPETAWYTQMEEPPQWAWLMLDLGKQTKLDRVEWSFSVIGFADDMRVQTSTDKITFVDVAAPNNAGSAFTWQTLTLNTTARYVRFYFLNPNERPQLGFINEVRVFSTGSATPTPTATPAPTVTPAGTIASGTKHKIVTSKRSSNSPSGSSKYAYDRKTATAWKTTMTTAPRAGWVVFDLGSAKQIGKVRWKFSQVGYADKFKIQVSNDGVNWTTVSTRTNAKSADAWQTSTPATLRSARYVRFYFYNPNNDPNLGYLSEVEIYS